MLKIIISSVAKRDIVNGNHEYIVYSHSLDRNNNTFSNIHGNYTQNLLNPKANNGPGLMLLLHKEKKLN